MRPHGGVTESSPPDQDQDQDQEKTSLVGDAAEEEQGDGGGKAKSEAERHPAAHRLSSMLAVSIRERDPKAKVNPDGDRWVRDMRLLIADRQGDIAEVERILSWSQSDPWWFKNILSPGSLREKFTQLLLKADGNSNGAADKAFEEFKRNMGGAA